MIFLLFVIYFGVLSHALTDYKSNNWAFIVAGSNQYYNYRHQADVCHAFHILHDKGKFPKENIIVMMYDDIAHNFQNPFQGNIINKPGGPNVYPGVNKDYIGEDCTGENFLAILRGDWHKMRDIGSGKVINSTRNDKIFVYFADHGARGLIAFPTGPYLYADEFKKTIWKMREERRYKEMTLYIEACESGSLFQDLSPSVNVFVSTSANAKESSYAYYFDEMRQAYLGDLYSINWLENADIADFSIETLQQEFLIVKNKTNLSHPQEFGNLQLGKETLDNFLSFDKYTTTTPPEVFNKNKQTQTNNINNIYKPVNQWDSKLAQLIYTKNVLSLKTSFDSDQNQKYINALLDIQIDEEIRHREISDLRFESLWKSFFPEIEYNDYNHAIPLKFECLRETVSSIEKLCGRFSDYNRQYIGMIVDLCEARYMPYEIIRVAEKTCIEYRE